MAYFLSYRAEYCLWEKEKPLSFQQDKQTHVYLNSGCKCFLQLDL